MFKQLDTVNNWYTVDKCEYPLGYYRLTQHAFIECKEATCHNLGITNTVICEGELSALQQVAKRQQLDCIV